MSATESENPVPLLVPATEDVLAPADALAATENAIEADPTSVDLIVESVQPDPVGKGYAFDWPSRAYYRGPVAKGPLEVRGLNQLVTWIEKCLRTARGAHPIHPEGYGMPPSDQVVFGMPVGRVPTDLEARVIDALKFHPRISGIENFTYDYDVDDEYLAVSFDVRLDDDSLLPVTDLALEGVI